jgi:hypothetical protein
MVVRISGGFAGTVVEIDDAGATGGVGSRTRTAPGPMGRHGHHTGRHRTDDAACRTSGPVDADLLGRLKEWRLQTAQSKSVPAYVVFSDATLEAIATARPRNELELSMIKGWVPPSSTPTPTTSSTWSRWTEPVVARYVAHADRRNCHPWASATCLN